MAYKKEKKYFKKQVHLTNITSINPNLIILIKIQVKQVAFNQKLVNILLLTK